MAAALRTFGVCSAASLFVVGLSLAGLAPRAAWAQAGPLVWVDVGGSLIEQPNSTQRPAGSLSAGLWHRLGVLGLGGDGAVTFADDSSAAAQWVLRTALMPSTSWLRWSRTEVDVSATTIGLVMPGHNGNRSASARQFVQLGPIGLTGGGGTGRTSRLSLDSKGHAYSGGLTLDVRGLHAGVTLQRAYTDDYQLMEASGITLWRQAMHYTLHDLTGDVSWRSARWFVAAGLGRRDGVDATQGSAKSSMFSAGWQATPSLLLIAQAGEQMADVVRGVPQARYAAGVIRWTPFRARGMRRASVSSMPSAASTREQRGPEILVTRGERGGVIELRIAATADAVVEVMSSTTDWSIVRLTREGDTFVHRLTLPSGTHRIAVRINGGMWRAPLGLVPVEDDFGTRVGLVVVP